VPVKLHAVLLSSSNAGSIAQRINALKMHCVSRAIRGERWYLMWVRIMLRGGIVTMGVSLPRPDRLFNSRGEGLAMLFSEPRP